jgi:hypothetical protein
MRTWIGMASGALLVCATVAQAAPLYGVASYGPFSTQNLYEIDPATGAATLIGSTGLTEINGIDYHEMYGIMVAYTTDSDLYALDLSTGAATLLADAPGIVPEGDLAYSAGTWYASNGGDFGTVDQGTAAFASIGAMGPLADNVAGVAVDVTGNVFGYSKNGANEDSLISINMGSGAAAMVGLTGLNADQAVGGLDFNPDDNVLFLTDHGSLYTVDTSSGAATLVGAHGVDGMSGLAFVPEPASLLVIMLGALLLRRR